METFHKHLLLSFFENTNIKLYFPHLGCERPPSTFCSFLVFFFCFFCFSFFFTTGLEQAIQEDLKEAFRQSVRSVSSRVKKSVNIKKWASGRNGQDNQQPPDEGQASTATWWDIYDCTTLKHMKHSTQCNDYCTLSVCFNICSNTGISPAWSCVCTIGHT